MIGSKVKWQIRTVMAESAAIDSQLAEVEAAAGRAGRRDAIRKISIYFPTVWTWDPRFGDFFMFYSYFIIIIVTVICLQRKLQTLYPTHVTFCG